MYLLKNNLVLFVVVLRLFPVPKCEAINERVPRTGYVCPARGTCAPHGVRVPRTGYECYGIEGTTRRYIILTRLSCHVNLKQPGEIQPYWSFLSIHPKLAEIWVDRFRFP
jgi:hypothetical protein